jgi:hypothetical protein
MEYCESDTRQLHVLHFSASTRAAIFFPCFNISAKDSSPLQRQHALEGQKTCTPGTVKVQRTIPMSSFDATCLLYACGILICKSVDHNGHVQHNQESSSRPPSPSRPPAVWFNPSSSPSPSNTSSAHARPSPGQAGYLSLESPGPSPHPTTRTFSLLHVPVHDLY